MSMYLPQNQNGPILITSQSKGIAVKLAEEREVAGGGGPVSARWVYGHVWTGSRHEGDAVGQGDEVPHEEYSQLQYIAHEQLSRSPFRFKTTS